MESGRRVKEEGSQNDLLARIAADPLFAPVHSSLGELLDPQLFVGRAPQQVTEFIEDDILPILTKYEIEIASTNEVEIKV
jgi:adenylosuccinate lyase